MSQNGRHSGFSPYSASGISWALAMTLGLAWPASASAATLNRFLTSQDLAGRMVLDQNGQPIELPTASDRHPALAKGSTPTYLAIPLYGGEHLPASIPALETGSGPGENPVGPLNFDSLVKANLDTELATAKLAVVDTPTRNYLVELLPGGGHSASALTTVAGTATSTVDELSQLLNASSNPLTKLTQGGMSALEKLLHINAKASTTVPSLNLEAQVLGSDLAPAPVPEPGTLMIFAGLIAGAALHHRSRSRPRGFVANN
jgi:hypothetical protein